MKVKLLAKILGTAILCLGLTLFAAHEVFAGDASSASLLGCWACQGPDGPTPLCFKNASQLELGGDPANYQLVPGAIRVAEDYALVDYQYVLKGNLLQVTYPNGLQLNCKRKAAAKGQKSETAKSASGSGNVSLLQGLFCRYKASSTYSSSYSSSTRVWFDGKGKFQYCSESSFSSNAGGMYNNGANTEGGSYRIQGNNVLLTFPDGSQGKATVNFRQAGGKITELKYEGDLYAQGLCD